MKLKTTLLAVCAATMLTLSSHAAIVMSYDNATGAYEVGGSDAGPGTGGFYLWTFTNSTIGDNIISLINRIITDGGFTGTVDATPIVSLNSGNGGPTVKGFSITNPSSGGALVFDANSGTIPSGMWTNGFDDFVGSAVASRTTSPFNLTVVPEPSTYAALAGFAALAFVVIRRRKI